MASPGTAPNPASFDAENEFDDLSWDPYAKRILVAEDDGEMRRLLVDSFRDDGYDVLEAGDGCHLRDYVEYLRSTIVNGRFFDVDAIISDIRMPGASGLEVLTEMRRYDSETPVILITAFGDAQTYADAHRAGASAVFDKPFDLDELRGFIKRLVPPTSRPGSQPTW
jgi:DNA-binding response OmpR family regulator